jgi:tRNA(fMet)-specific endonuclease VapC
MNGSSQAVRLPAEYRFEKPDDCIARIGSMVVIYPKEEAWNLFESAIGSVSDDFTRLGQGKSERDLAALDPTPAPVRTRVYRKKGSGEVAAARLSDVGLDRAHISTITVGERLTGAARSSDAPEHTARVVRFCASLQVAPFDDRAAASYAVAHARLAAKGTPIGPLDTLIAGHAMALGATLVTENTREFDRVEGLAIENWVGERR